MLVGPEQFGADKETLRDRVESDIPQGGQGKAAQERIPQTPRRAQGVSTHCCQGSPHEGTRRLPEAASPHAVVPEAQQAFYRIKSTQ